MRSTISRAAVTVVAGLSMWALATPAAMACDDGDAMQRTKLTRWERSVIKMATKELRSPQAAVAAGYQATDDCVENPGVGGMGYHYVNLDHLNDGKIDPRKPEVLVFVPTHDGGRRLGAIEYLQVDADQNVTTDDDRPYLFRRYPFDGPMDGHGPGQPVHYDLHVWLYKHNPAGQLQAWNPAVHCPTD